MKRTRGFPGEQGLYNPKNEHDSCGVGFVCNINGAKSNDIVKKGLKILNRLAHRGAVGADPKTGDGAGILIQLPHDFMTKVTEKEKIELPAPAEYGTGIVFLPQDVNERSFCRDVFSKVIDEEKQTLLGWRKVPVDNSRIGLKAKETQPSIEQIFIGRNPELPPNRNDDGLDFERILYVIRKRTENISRTLLFRINASDIGTTIRNVNHSASNAYLLVCFILRLMFVSGRKFFIIFF